jgi:predicted RNase H-like HicB family nuclease
MAVYQRRMARQFQVFVEHDRSEMAWVTCVPALDHLSTFGSTRDEALDNTREAILGYLEAMRLVLNAPRIADTPASK